MVLVGSLGVYIDWEFKVFSLWSPGGSNMVNYLKHIYPWWIWLSDSIFLDVGVIFTLGWSLDKISSLASFLGLAYLVKVFHSWGFSRLMTVIGRSMCSRIILSLVSSTSSFWFVALSLTLSTVVCSKVYGRGGIKLGQTLVVSIAIFNCQLIH